MSLSPKENGDLPASMMTKREMMAIQITAGLWSNPDFSSDTLGEVARTAIDQADVLLAELAKETK